MKNITSESSKEIAGTMYYCDSSDVNLFHAIQLLYKNIKLLFIFLAIGVGLFSIIALYGIDDEYQATARIDISYLEPDDVTFKTSYNNFIQKLKKGLVDSQVIKTIDSTKHSALKINTTVDTFTYITVKAKARKSGVVIPALKLAAATIEKELKNNLKPLHEDIIIKLSYFEQSLRLAEAHLRLLERIEQELQEAKLKLNNDQSIKESGPLFNSASNRHLYSFDALIRLLDLKFAAQRSIEDVKFNLALLKKGSFRVCRG